MHATRTGHKCVSTGPFRCVGCGLQQTVRRETPFPQCPVCNRDTTWVAVVKKDPPDDRRGSAPNGSSRKG